MPKKISLPNFDKKLLPGLGLCFVLALPCWFLGKLMPVIGGPVFAILAGMLVALFYKQRPKTQAGIAFTSKKVLQYAVILLGFGLNLSEIARVGLISLPIIISTILTSLIVAFVVYKLAKMPANTAVLIGVGSSICGGSAIAATAPVIKADDEEIAQSISVIFLFNVLAALIFPTLGGLLGLSNEGFGLFAGTAVNDTSSVTAAAAAWDGMHPGANTLGTATIVKLTRTLAIIPITLALAFWRALRQPGAGANGFKLQNAFPMFILYFVLASVITTLASLLGVPTVVFFPFKELAKFCIILAMAAIGLNTDLVKLIKGGRQPLMLGLCCWLAITFVSLFMQHIMGIW